MKPGATQFAVTLHAGDGVVAIFFADAGPGITDPGAALQRGRSGRGSTGLGLDIAWRIVVNKHHGDLRVESQPGDTRFEVRLPIQQEQPEQPEQPQQ